MFLSDQDPAADLQQRPTWLGWLGFAWGVGGLVLLLGSALWRLTPIALEPLITGVSWPVLALYGGWVLFNGYTEGVRGFQRSFSPRFAARARHLLRHPRPLHVVLAPLYCMGFFHARRRSLILAWGLLVGISGLVLLVRALDQPWRGVVDGGVVVGLGWGLVATLIEVLLVTAGRRAPADPHLPAG